MSMAYYVFQVERGTDDKDKAFDTPDWGRINLLRQLCI